MGLIKMERDMKKIKEGLIEYVNYRLDQIKEGVYDNPKELFLELRKFHRENIAPLVSRDYRQELAKLEDRIEDVERSVVY